MRVPFASALFCFANPANASASSCNSYFFPPSFISVAVGQLGPSDIELCAAREGQRQHTSLYSIRSGSMRRYAAYRAACTQSSSERERESERERYSLILNLLSSEEALAHARSAR